MTSLTTEPTRAATEPAAGPAGPAGPAFPATRHDHRAELVAGRAAACVWGLGHIGWSTVEALRAEGVAVVGDDLDPPRAEQRGADAAGAGGAGGPGSP
ncbi:hypothetical protein AB0E16_22950, partial [Streptomyces sp. NPDC047970]|uniref:hypothetical protein n=1 Tax=Streptomyces sp. NPDC047970 TaxID=3155481 RepID=UPI00341724B8